MRSLQLLDHSCARVLSGNEGTHASAAPNLEAVDLRPFITGDSEKRTNYVAMTEGGDSPGIRVFAIEDHSQPQEIAHYVPSQRDLDHCRIVDFTYHTVGQQLCLSTCGGDIVLIKLDQFKQGEDAVEIVGSVESGIMAMAWSPDQDLVVLITGERNVLEMTDDFETITEFPLHVEHEGEGVQHSVGWGRKETQFHGSEGKEAALRKVDTAKFSVSEDEDNLPRVSWRGDGSFFVCSDVDPRKSARVLRIYNREGALQNTSEPVDRLEHSLDWRPSGNLIVSSQRLPHRHDIVFFERNGLRHGEFTLRETEKHKVLEVSWNSDSTVLAVWLAVENESTGIMQKSVQFWTMGNYHWYMKQHLILSGFQNITGFAWDSEVPLRAHIISNTGYYHQFNFTWDVIASTSIDENNPGYVAVVDGASILLTPFSNQNVPPPMSALKINNDSNVQLISFGEGTKMAVASAGKVQFYQLPENSRGESTLLGSLTLPSTATHQHACLDNPVRQLSWTSTSKLLYIQHDEQTGLDMLCIVDFTMGTKEPTNVEVVPLEMPAGRLYYNVSNGDTIVQDVNGTIYEVELSDTSVPRVTKVLSFIGFCPWIGTARIGSQEDQLERIVIGLTERRALYANDRLLSSECTSFFLRGDWLVFTTTSHTARFLPLNVDFEDFVLSDDAQDANDESYRRVERGSKIVVATQSKPNLVLQMPRGNLETISPRAFVLASIREDLKHLNFRSAFIACRRNRIDLNILYDENPKQFFDNIKLFIEQVPEVDHLNLFLSTLRNEDTSATMYRRRGKQLTSNEPSSTPLDKVNLICKEIRSTLIDLGRKRYIQSIISTYVRSSPPDLESVLSLLTEIRESNVPEAEDALKYTIFLCKADSLYDVALGMYNFPLVLMVAQQAQMDPREYLPFLQELQSLETYYQRFKIDDHLKRNEKALHNLIRAGDAHFQDVLIYMQKHTLYLAALQDNTLNASQTKTIWELYGDYLEGKSTYEEAAIAYTLASVLEKALQSYRKAGCWREAFSTAKKIGYDDAYTQSLADSIADELEKSGRLQDAATVASDYLKDPEKAVSYLIKGNLFQEAVRILHLYNRNDLFESHIEPGLYDGYSEMEKTIDEIKAQFEKQTARLQELRNKKIEQPHALQHDESLDNIDMFSDTTSMHSQFTRYTKASSRVSTISSSSSRRSSKQKRKEDRKRARGKKGTVFEEEYLVNSLKRLYERISNLQNDVGSLLRALVPCDRREWAQALQKSFSTLLDMIKQQIPVIFVPLQLVASMGPLEGTEGIANAPVNIEKPVITEVQWKLQLL